MAFFSMALPPFPYRSPLGPADPKVGLLGPPAPEIGEVRWGCSDAPSQDAPARPFWHPLKNPYLTGGVMTLAALFAASAAQAEGAGMAAGVLLVGYGISKGVGALFGGPGSASNFLVGERGMQDIRRAKGELSKRVILWTDVAWWGATPEQTPSAAYVRHVQLDSQHRLMDLVNPFGFRFTRDPQTDPESAALLQAHGAWLQTKLRAVSAALEAGQSVEVPLMATQNAGRLVTGVRPGSFVSVTRDRISVSIDGQRVFEAPRAETVLRWEHKPSAGRVNSHDVHCALHAAGRSWSAPRYELPRADVLAALVRGAA